MQKGLKSRTVSIVADEVNIEIRSRARHPMFFEKTFSDPKKHVSIHITENTEKEAQDKYNEQKEIIVKPSSCNCNIL